MPEGDQHTTTTSSSAGDSTVGVYRRPAVSSAGRWVLIFCVVGLLLVIGLGIFLALSG